MKVEVKFTLVTAFGFPPPSVSVASVGENV
jgi:hypothetical protein